MRRMILTIFGLVIALAAVLALLIVMSLLRWSRQVPQQLATAQTQAEAVLSSFMHDVSSGNFSGAYALIDGTGRATMSTDSLARLYQEYPQAYRGFASLRCAGFHVVATSDTATETCSGTVVYTDGHTEPFGSRLVRRGQQTTIDAFTIYPQP